MIIMIISVALILFEAKSHSSKWERQRLSLVVVVSGFKFMNWTSLVGQCVWCGQFVSSCIVIVIIITITIIITIIILCVQLDES